MVVRQRQDPAAGFFGPKAAIQVARLNATARRQHVRTGARHVDSRDDGGARWRAATAHRLGGQSRSPAVRRHAVTRCGRAAPRPGLAATPRDAAWRRHPRAVLCSRIDRSSSRGTQAEARMRPHAPNPTVARRDVRRRRTATTTSGPPPTSQARGAATGGKIASRLYPGPAGVAGGRLNQRLRTLLSARPASDRDFGAATFGFAVALSQRQDRSEGRGRPQRLRGGSACWGYLGARGDRIPYDELALA